MKHTKKQALVSYAKQHQKRDLYTKHHQKLDEYQRDCIAGCALETHKAERAQIKYTDEQLKIADKLLENSTL